MSEAQESLRKLRDRLETIEPVPWNGIKAWVSSATPLMKRAYLEFYDDFVKITETPDVPMMPSFSSGGGGSRNGPQRDDSNEVEAEEAKLFNNKATQAKINILAFIDGVLDLQEISAPVQAQSQVKGQA